MLIPTFLLHDGLAPGGSEGITGDPDIMQSFEISVTTLSALPAFYNTIFNLQEAPFCITLNLPAKNTDAIVPHLDQLIDVCLLTSFHYRYLFFKFLTPFLVLKGSQDLIDHCTPIITQRFQSQGFAGIDYQVIEGYEYQKATSGNRKSYVSRWRSPCRRRSKNVSVAMSEQGIGKGLRKIKFPEQPVTGKAGIRIEVPQFLFCS